MEVSVVKDAVMDTNGGNPIKVCTKSCYACGEEGHISQDCTKKGAEYLGEFPTIEVEYDPQEIENLISMKKSKKRKQRSPQNNPISTEKDLSHITCSSARIQVTTPINAQERNQEPGEQAQSPRSPKTCRKSFVFTAWKQDILLLNVQLRRKLNMSR
jgi:hypothetical protein